MALTAGEVEVLLKAKDEASAAIEKVSKEIKKLGPEAEKSGSATNFLNSSFAKLTASFSVASLIEKGVSALVGYGVAAIQSASQITDLAAKTGLTTDEIQRMSYVAAQTNTSLEAFTNASYRLGVALSSGSTGVVNALKELGIEWERIRHQSPTDQINQVFVALGRMQSETERNRIAQELFGRSFSEVAAAVAAGYDKIKEKAVVASRDQVEAVAAAQNAWEGFKKNLTTAILSELGKAYLSLTAEQKKAAERMKEASGATQTLAFDTKSLTEEQEKQLKAAMASIQAETQLKAAVDTGSLSRRKYTDELSNLRASLAAIKPATIAEIEAMLALGHSSEEVAREFNLTAQKVDMLKTQFADNKRKAEELNDAMAELDSSAGSFRSTVAGLDGVMVQAIKRYMEAGVSQGALAKAYNMTGSEISAIAKHLEAEKKLQLEVGKLNAEAAEARMQAGGTATEKAIADIQRWATEVTLRMKQANADTHIFYDALANTSRVKLEQSMVDWDRLGTVSKKHLEDTAARARATYEQMVGDSGNYGAAAIETQRQVALAAADAARNYRDANFEALDAVVAKADEAAKKIAEFMNAQTLNQQAMQSFSMDLKPFTQFEQQAMREDIQHGGQMGNRSDDPIWSRLKLLESIEGTRKPDNNREFFALQREAVELARLRQWAQGRQRPPGFATGVNRFVGGQAIVGERGPELLDLPSGSSITPFGKFGGGGDVYISFGAGSIVSNVPLDSPQTVMRMADMVKKAIVKDDRNRGRTIGRS